MEMPAHWMTLHNSTNAEEIASAAREYGRQRPDESRDVLTYAGFGVLSSVLAQKNAEIARLKFQLKNEGIHLIG